MSRLLNASVALVGGVTSAAIAAAVALTDVRDYTTAEEYGVPRYPMPSTTPPRA